MKKVINCAHRGAMAYEPENTLRSFRRAAEMGADQIELDVFLTADRVPVITHGARLHTEPHDGNVRRMPLEQVRQLRTRGEPIPTLQEAMDLCRETGMTMNIEIKDRGAINETVALIRQNDFYEHCVVSCFLLSVLRRVRARDARIPVGYLVVPFLQRKQMRLAGFSGCFSVNPFFSRTDADYVRAAHQRGLEVHVWTVNKPDDMRRMIGLGVDAILTNKPDVLVQIKREMGVA